MKRIISLLMAAIFAAFVSPAFGDEKLSLAEISSYFNGIETAQTNFRQINDDGLTSTGKIFIHRPGRIRFEYDPPDHSLVVAGRSQVAVFDAKSNQRPQKFALTRTPLYLILAKTVDLEHAKMVIGHTVHGATTSVLAQDPKHPEYGTIQMVFSAEPVALRQWIITDGSGQRTTVLLGEFALGGSFPRSMFDIKAEEAARGF